MPTPRDEYPRPQFVRPDWLGLNGQWQFEIDQGDSGIDRGLLERELNGTITVPFCPESRLSGIENHDYLNAVWYRRNVTVPAQWAGRRVLLHFQAVDYDATVWVNGIEVGRHRGGFSPFTCDLHGVAAPAEEAVITVRARDTADRPQPRTGKQSREYGPHRAIYVRTTGIWQTVWMEPVPTTWRCAAAAADAGRGRRHHSPRAAADRQRARHAPARHAQRCRWPGGQRRVRRRPGSGPASRSPHPRRPPSSVERRRPASL